MFATFAKLLHRRPCISVLAVAVSSFCLIAEVDAQSPPVVASYGVAVPHTGTFGNLWQSAVSTRGDFVVYDFKTDGLFEFPATGGPEIVIAAPGVIAGGFTNSGLAIDPRNNNIYLDDNYNGDLLEYPYDAATNAWDLPSVRVGYNLAGSVGSNGSCAGYQPNGNYFQGAGLSMNASGVLAVATENGCGVEIFTVPIDMSGNFGAATPIVSNMKARAKSLAIDNAGNISYTEDGGNPGALFIPAGTTSLQSEATVSRIDPKLSSVQGVSVDTVGNIYVADGTAGTYLVPLQAGVPNPTQAILVSNIPAAGGPTIDPARGTLFYQITNSGSIADIVKIYLNRTEFGMTPSGGAGTSVKVNYLFSASEAPYTFTIEQDGLSGVFAAGDVSGCGITFTTTTDAKGNVTTTENAPTTYAANGTCAIPITFTPTAVGRETATLLMLDKSGNLLNSSVLHGAGSGSLVTGLPGTESPIGAGLKAPSQVAVDAAGNTYVADSGLGKVLEYPAKSNATTVPVSLGTSLVAPTGVAVDGAGNVYIADSGKVFQIPYAPGGLVATGQTTIKTGLGTRLTLATDGIGDLFIADPDNQRYIRLRTVIPSLDEVDTVGFTQLSAITADGTGDVFLANGQNLIELSAAGQQTVYNQLANANGLAVDHSGAVYVTSPTQTIRIPNVGGTLSATGQVVVAAAATKPASVAVDSAGNAYVADLAAGDVDLLSTNPFVNLGTLGTTTSQSTGNITITDGGNQPLTITGFGSTPDYTVTSNTCVGAAIAVGASCNATVTFNPGPGDQGLLPGQLAIQGNEFNVPSNINATGTGVALAASKTTISVNKPSVTNAPVQVTVASASATGPVPTGSVTVTATGTGLTPVVVTQALVNGMATINETAVAAGTITFTVKYLGDRVYGTSTATVTSPVTQGSITLIQPAASTVPIYVLSSGAGSFEPYDGSGQPYFYNYPVSVKTANGAPLLGVPIISNGMQTGTDYGNVTYQIAGGASACVGTGSIIAVNADGTAPLDTNCLAINTSNNQIPNITTTYTVTPVYTGNTDPSYASVTGVPVTFVAIPNPMVVLSTATPALTVSAGSTASANITLTSLLGYGITGVLSNLNRNYSLPVTMDCDALPAHATCSFAYPTPDPSDPSSVAVTPTTPGQVVMTLHTNVSAGTYQAGISRTPAYFAAFFSIGMFGMAMGRRKGLRLSLLSLVVAFLFSSAVLGMSACSSANISAAPTLTTPKGTYTITVTAKQAGSRQVPSPTVGAAPVTIVGNGNQMSIPFTMQVTVQ